MSHATNNGTAPSVGAITESAGPAGALARATGSELSGTGPEVVAYLNTLKPGERVIETGQSCMTGIKGVVYESKSGGGTCVMWELPDGKMGTSVTWGTRRLTDLPNIKTQTGVATPPPKGTQ